MKIYRDRLARFVAALELVINELPEARVVDMKATTPPTCGTPGCHAGLAMLALDRLKVKKISDRKTYNFLVEATRLSNYLTKSRRNTSLLLKTYANKHPEWWGNDHGWTMFQAPAAFGQNYRNFPSQVILDHWKGVLARTPE